MVQPRLLAEDSPQTVTLVVSTFPVILPPKTAGFGVGFRSLDLTPKEATAFESPGLSWVQFVHTHFQRVWMGITSSLK